MPNSFLQGVQGASAVFAPMLNAQVNAQDMRSRNQELSLRIRNQDLREKQQGAILEHYQNEDARADRAADRQEMDSALQREVRRFNLENEQMERAEYLEGLKSLTEARKALMDAKRDPGADYQATVRDLLGQFAWLGSSVSPQIRSMAKELEREALTHMQTDLSLRRLNSLSEAGFLQPGNTDPGAARAAQTTKDMSDLKAYAAQNDVAFDSLDHSGVSYQPLENGELQPETKATLKAAVDRAVKKRQLEALADKANRITVTRKMGEDEFTYSLTPEQAREQGLPDRLGAASEPLDPVAQVKAERLESMLRRLLEAKARKVGKVDRGEILGDEPSLDTNPWWGGMPIDDAIDSIRERIQALEGGGKLTPAESFNIESTIGTRENPHKPQTAEELSRLPSGAAYVNPADGKLYLKR